MIAAITPLDEKIRRMEPVAAPPEARQALRMLAKALAPTVSEASPLLRHKLGAALSGPSGDSIPLPEPMYHLLARIVEVLVRGDAVTIVPVGKELTTQQAADVLNVSRQYLVRLLEGGKLAHRKTGKHRRVRVEDVLAFKAERDSERAKQLDDLAAMTQDFGGYPELE